MRRIYTRLAFFFSVFLLFFFLVSSQAQARYSIIAIPEDTSSPESPNVQPTQPEATAYLHGDIGKKNSENTVTENTKSVKIRFEGLPANQTYRLCLSEDCTDSDSKIEEIEQPKGGSLEITVCADGKNKLKIYTKGTEACHEEDYFWGRQIYSATLLREDNIIAEAPAFFVSMYYPQVRIEPEKPTINDPIKVYIKGTRRLHDNIDRNNYAVEIANASEVGRIFDQQCVDVADGDEPYANLNTWSAGSYIIKINEQTRDSGSGSGCTAEFTFYHIKVSVYEPNYTGLKKSPVYEVDPHQSDLRGITKSKVAPSPPCASLWSETDGCLAVKTGLGIDIHTKPGEFIGDVFGIVLGISGGIALILIIYSGYQIITSAGKPERLEAAREQLVSALIGLVFIVLALTITQIIGVDILKLPGFSR